MPRFATLLAALALVLAVGPAGHAAYNMTLPPASTSDLEIVVVEAQGCTYCRFFRRDVLPSYKSSELAASLDMRFLDVNELEAGAIELEATIDVVPTVLLVKSNKEVGRIAGYVGPEDFVRELARLIAGAE
jgi:thioredoxin-related protein